MDPEGPEAVPVSRLREYIARHHIGLIALFVALSGSAYAATKVGSGDIERDAVKSRHIDDGQVRSRDVQDDGLTGTDVDEATLGSVPRAGVATRAESADSAASAGFATRSDTADSAGLLDGLDSSDFIRSGTAINADRLDGLDSGAFVQQADPIDADTLGGKPASSFFQGVALRGGALPDPNTSANIDLGDIRVTYACPNNAVDPGTITLKNLSASTMIIAALEGGPGAEIFQLQPNGQAGDSHNDVTTAPSDATIYEVLYFKNGVTFDGQLAVTTNHVVSGCDVGARSVLYAFS